MELLEFKLERMERELTLQNYERVKPEVEKLLGQGYSPYSYLFGRKLLRDTDKERRLQREATAQRQADTKNESQTSGGNEGSI